MSMPLNSPMNFPQCQTQTNPWCTKRSEFSFICKVEGREVRMCGPCHDHWKVKAQNDPYLLARCPNCTRNHVATPSLPRPVLTTESMLGIYTEAALVEAMRRVGVLVDQQKRVINLLKTDLSVWTDSQANARAGAHASG